ncbi:MAG: hypothetical protein K0Q94_3498 [Paenibacillus sp.]|nr:hypothetical protein [Paenibacillus sp.]
MNPHLLGLMTHKIGSPGRFSRHADAALAAGFSGVILFTPAGVHVERGTVTGYVRQGRSPWRKQSAAHPPVAIDLGYYTTPLTNRQVFCVKNRTRIQFTGHGLGNKWTIQNHLLASPLLASHLLPTKPMDSVDDAIAYAREHEAIMIKPINGKGGIGILKLCCTGSAYRLHENGKPALSGGPGTIRAALRRARRKGGYLLQRWIDIRNPEGRVFDVRVLMQKDGTGQWETSGMAIREGSANSITSNLKSGGRAHEVAAYLNRLFPSDKADALMEKLCELSVYIPPYLEERYGRRLADLGLDFAIDRSGCLWLLEVNIKPGKAVIRQVYGEEAARRCFLMPFREARRLALSATATGDERSALPL